MADKDTSSPYQMKAQDKKLTPTTKAFENRDFLLARESRLIRILCEFTEPADRLRCHKVKGTVLFFGSARSMNKSDFDSTIANLMDKYQNANTSEADKKSAMEQVEKFKKVEWMCPYVDITEELARMVTEWSMQEPQLKEMFNSQPDYLTGEVHEASGQPLVVTSGGGPGIMEAANKGAASVPGALSMGMGISLPFEKGLNPFVSDKLAFSFHYFFTRKFWMMYSAKALVVGPGGFGTMDELFELLTLRQTGKVPDVPIVLLGAKFWKTVVNWQALADYGTISQAEVDRLCFADDAQTAFEFIKKSIGDATHVRQVPPVSPSQGPRPSGVEVDKLDSM